MKRLLFTASLALLAGSLPALGQELLQIKFQATCQITNETGKLVKEKVNNDSLLQDYADQNGITNLHLLALVYSVNGDERGDVIQIVSATNAAVLSHVYGLFFAEDLSSADGSQLQRFAYMYNSQQAISMGSASVSEKIKIDKNGNTNRTINGNVQYYLTPAGSNGLRLCTGTFSASKPFVTNAPPPVASTNEPGSGSGQGQH